MNEHQNTAVVQQAYQAFGQGDIDGLLSQLGDDIDWESIHGAQPHVPTHGNWVGRSEVGRFFGVLGANMSFSAFEPREFIAQGDTVVVLGHYAGSVIPTGRGFDADWVMVFKLRDGKIVRFREYGDSAALNAAYAAA